MLGDIFQISNPGISFSQVQELDIYQHSRIGYIRSFTQVLKIYRKPKTKGLRIADATTVASEIIWI
jgi:adenylylsulfate kinase-like enzyme